MSLSLLTVGLVYELNAQYVLYQDFNGLNDVTPPNESYSMGFCGFVHYY